jgi:class 3 adenylate cyclase
MAVERAQRRLAAILAADVVGYSRLMEHDEAGTLAALKARREGILEPLVREHHGRIVKVMGDGALVEFGSAVNAVACAVELQKRMGAANDGTAAERHIDLRVGVNLGDVVVEGSDLYGDGVIIAVRLEAMAEPGGVCISDDALHGRRRARKACLRRRRAGDGSCQLSDRRFGQNPSGRGQSQKSLSRRHENDFRDACYRRT